MDLGEFFLNNGEEQKAAQVVEAPAFSLTKVMAVVAPLITAVVAVVTAAIKDTTFTTAQITALIIALIAFLAVTSAADVLARGIATSAEKTASGRMRSVQFPHPLSAKLAMPGGGHEDVAVLAASDASPPEFLCVRENKKVEWRKGADVKFDG